MTPYQVNMLVKTRDNYVSGEDSSYDTGWRVFADPAAFIQVKHSVFLRMRTDL